MSSYTEAQKKYYFKNKDTIYRKTKKYKEEYNRKYYEKNKLVIQARRKLKEIEASCEASKESLQKE